MAPTITPDLQQNILVTLYLLFSHNYIVFAYFLGLIISIILAIYRPSRFTTFILLGFAILLFSFEYDKHIILPLRDQTINSLITLTPHYKVQKIVDLLISVVLPVLFYTIGWLFIFLAIINASLDDRKRNKSRNEKR